MQMTHVQHAKRQYIETSEGQNTRNMQYNAQMIKPAMDRPKTCQISALNILKLRHKRVEDHAHRLARKQGIRNNSQKQLKSGMCESMTEEYALKSHVK